MSGGYVPYHFRQNKAIDRHLFVELLHRLQKELPVRSYRYVGFGGPFLEDLKLMHAHFGISKLVSLEIDDRVLRRQKFNKPVSCIDLLSRKSADFIDEDGFEEKTILWLDYASPKQLRQQLEEVQKACGKMAIGDVLKVTLNANMSAYVPNLDTKSASERVTAFKTKVGNDYYPPELQEAAFEDVTSFPAIVLKSFERAVKRGAAGADCVFQPLAAYAYSDGSHSMLTTTGVMLGHDAQARREFLAACELDSWEFATSEWAVELTQPNQIRIPDLSLRERLYLDTQLPKLRTDKRLSKRVLKKIGPALTSRSEDEEDALKQYALFYRHFPYLSRIIV